MSFRAALEASYVLEFPRLERRSRPLVMVLVAVELAWTVEARRRHRQRRL